MSEGMAILALVLWSLPAWWLVLELWCGLGHRRVPTPPADAWPRILVVVPAHDEAATLAGTLSNLRAELGPDDRLVVGADHCRDGTVVVACRHGAHVVRVDDGRRGKGRVIARVLADEVAAGRDVVAIVDADCRLTPGTLRRGAALCARHGRPVQPIHLLDVREGGSTWRDLSAFAFLVRNGVRQRGLQCLCGACQVVGGTTFFPLSLARELPWDHALLAEDYRAGIAAAQRGHAPLLDPAGLVVNAAPDGREAVIAQRRRWIIGHVGTALRLGPVSLLTALRRRDRRLLGVAGDLCLPPLSWLAAVWVLPFALGVGSPSLRGSPSWWLALGMPWPAMAGALAVVWRRGRWRGVTVEGLAKLPRFLWAQGMALLREGHGTSWEDHGPTRRGGEGG